MKTFFAAFIFLSVAAFAQNHQCPCEQIGLEAKWAAENAVKCYLMPVPRDSNPAPGKYYLAVAVAESQGKHEPLLYLHGGPGIATLGNLPKYLKSETWQRIRDQRPLIFFDYRGTGASQPELCPGLEKELAEVSVKMPASELHAYKLEKLRKCRAAHLAEGIDVAAFSSNQSALDAEAIRNLLNIPLWNVYGVSHGSTVALNLLRNHPQSIRAMILDSPFPPNAPWLDFVRPFAKSFENLEHKIAADPTARARFPNIRETFASAVESLNTQPLQIAIDASGNTRPFTGNDFAWSIWYAMLKPVALPVVPLAISEFEKRNAAIVMDWMTAFSDPEGFGKFSDLQSKAILCYEGSPKTADDTKESLAKKYPEFAAFNIDFEDDLCAVWQPKRAPAKAFEPVVSDVPVLILSGEYDPVCPPIFGELASRTLPRSTFLSIPAESHAAIHADDCLRGIAMDFLLNPEVKVNTQCVARRPKILFATEDLKSELEKIKNVRNSRK